MADNYYLWSPFQNGGEVTVVKNPLGVERNVVAKRNIVPVGERVTKAKLGVDEDEWDTLVEAGVIRDYPYPEGAGSTESPINFLRRTLREAAMSEEERLVAAVQGATTNEEAMVALQEEIEKDEDKK